MNELDELARIVDNIATRTQFNRVTASEVCSQPPPGDVALWQAPYALLVLAMLPMDDLTQGASDYQAWLDEALAQREQAARAAVDGYLVLAVDGPPADLSVVQAISLDRRVCRKHIVWPSHSGERWSDLEAIAVLGLPDELIPFGDEVLPRPPKGIVQLWDGVVGARSDRAAIDYARRVEM